MNQQDWKNSNPAQQETSDMTKGKVVEKKCSYCGDVFYPKEADVKRGWGKFCSKSCKASQQTKDTGIAGAHFKAKGRSVNQMKNGKFSKSKFKYNSGDKFYRTTIAYEDWDDEVLNGDVVWSDRYGWLVRDDGSGDIDAHPFDSDAAGFRNT